MGNTPTISIKNLTVKKEEALLLEEVSLSVESGKLTAIFGPNGGGKSTLLKTIMGVNRYKGQLDVFNKAILDFAKDDWHKIAYLPQMEEIDWDFPITVREVVEMGFVAKRPINRRMNAIEKEKSEQVIDRVGIAPIIDSPINQLSGGERKRMVLARALLQDAEMYLLDEPFAALDVFSEKIILDILKELVEEGKTCLVVHHDPLTIKKHFDYAVLINKRVMASGLPEEVF